MKIGEAFVEVRPDTSKFGAEATRGVSAGARKAKASLDDLFSAQTVVGAGAVVGISRLVGSASDLNESLNKTQATFGDASGAVEAFASTSADSFGISEAAALDLAGGLGAMLIPLGTSQEEAAGMSTRLLELAADMGSFNDQDPTEMLDRIRAGLAGEAEPLRQYGVSINEARVQQYAWENGIAEAGTALTDQQKIMARYGLILQDTATQQGDFANTADSAANAQRRAAATAEDSAASIGSNFLPIYEQGVAAVQGLANAFGALPGPVQSATVLLGAFVALRGPLSTIFSIVGDAAKGMAQKFTEAGGGVRGLSAALSAGTIIGGTAVIGLGLITNAMAQQAQTAKETEERVKGLADAYTEGGIQAAGQTFLDQITEDAPEVLDALEGMEGGIGQFVNTVAGGGDEAAAAIDALGAAIAGVPIETWRTFQEGTGPFIPGDQQGAILEAQHALNLFVDPLTRAAAESENLTANQEDVAEATATAADRFDDEVSALQEVADSADEARDKLDALFGVQMSMDEATTAVQQSSDDLSRSIRENGRHWDENTQKGRDNMAAARDAAGAIRDMAIAHRTAGGTMQEVTGRSRMLEGGLRNQLRAAGLTKGQIDRLIETYARVPRRVLSQISQVGAEAVISDLQRIYIAAQRAATAVQQIGGSLAGGGSYGGARAVGGPVMEGTSYLVGEQGPELFTPGATGAITPAATGSPQAWNGGGGDLHLHFGDVYGDPEAFARSIAPVVGRELAAIDRGV